MSVCTMRMMIMVGTQLNGIYEIMMMMMIIVLIKKLRMYKFLLFNGKTFFLVSEISLLRRIWNEYKDNECKLEMRSGTKN